MYILIYVQLKARKNYYTALALSGENSRLIYQRGMIAIHIHFFNKVAH